MKITCLIENLVYKSGLVAEHGLSFYIETEQKKILFDTGQSNNIIHNAKILGIDLANIDAVVVSHGHYDHTGGLYAFLWKNEKARVYLKQNALLPKYKGTAKIGMPDMPALFHDRFEYVTKPIALTPEINIMPRISIFDKTDTHWRGFEVEEDGKRTADFFEDELFLAIVRNHELSVISSCSHRGITNILQSAIQAFPLPLHLVAGGFHLKDTGKQGIDTILASFKILAPQKIGVCHCTGIDQYLDIKTAFPAQTFYFYTGVSIEI